MPTEPNRTLRAAYTTGLCVLWSVLCVTGVLRAQGHSDLPHLTQPVANDSTFGDVREGAPPLWHDMITNLPADWGRAAVASFDIEALPGIATLVIVTGALVAGDNQSYRATRDAYEQSPTFRSAANTFVEMGDGKYHFGLAGAFAAYGLAAGDNHALQTASQTAEALLACGVIVHLLKHITGRESPASMTSKTGTWRLFTAPAEYYRRQTRYYAFPSGHIATTMATVTVLAENYPEATWIRAVGYPLVGLVGVGLVARGYHWYSDLPLGIALGYSFGKLVTHPLIGEHDDASRSVRINVSPTITTAGGGIAMVFGF